MFAWPLHVHIVNTLYIQFFIKHLTKWQCPTGFIAQGLLQMLSVLHSQMVWRCFGSWIRTLRSGIPPSAQAVGMALRHSLPEFLAGSDTPSGLATFINDRLDLNRAEGLRLAA